MYNGFQSYSRYSINGRCPSAIAIVVIAIIIILNTENLVSEKLDDLLS